MSGKNLEPLNVEPVNGYYIFTLNVEPVNGYYIFIDFRAGYRVGNAGYWGLDAPGFAFGYALASVTASLVDADTK
ncbi:MAG: hypothetical protein JRI92_11970 [Deltaproteobacteria bacterium]|nr:hypothetical protein [Deltaproteobacteria bacterium]